MPSDIARHPEGTQPTQAQAWADERGTAAIEYGLLAALVVIGAMVGFSALGVSIGDLFTYWSTKVAEALAQIP